jgi:hypothetical protein
MYVEVKGRQTGKTTRLVDSIIDYLKNNSNNSALIVARTEESRKSIQNKVNEKCGRPCEYRTITSYKMLPPSEKGTIKQFVDEFWGLNPKKLVVDKKAYYTTSTYQLINLKAVEIIDFYRENESKLKPNKILFKHKM